MKVITNEQRLKFLSAILLNIIFYILGIESKTIALPEVYKIYQKKVSYVQIKTQKTFKTELLRIN